MATAVSPTPPTAKNRRKLVRNILLGVVALIALLIWWSWASIEGQARVGTAYGAHVACSCRYVEGRDLKSCESDFEEGMGMINVSEDAERKRITASFPLVASTTSEFRTGFGCINLSEEEAERD